jgi:cytochrome c-type biogenesis protein CcmH
VRHAARAVLAAAVALWWAGPLSAQDSVARARPPVATPVADSALDATTAAVSSSLRCPVCQGESIQESPSSLAQDMRAVVRQRLRAGETPEQVKAYFVSKYGEWILLKPAATGLNKLLYLFPVLFVGGGLALVVFLVRRWTSPGTGAPPASGAPDDPSDLHSS